jgi:enoyl-CoA hydratase/carnithine racemase
MTGGAAVLLDKLDGIAVVSLNRPEVLNAYSMAMRDALHSSLEAVRDDPEISAMVLRGNGPAFCSGGDLREFGSAASVVAARQARWRRDVWDLLYRLAKPTIAAVHGFVVGGGFEMALLCDLCIASRDARFFYPETGLAMIPGVCGTQTTPRLAGAGRALDLVLSGRELTAAQAVSWGLVTRVVPVGRVDATAKRLARQLARQPAGLVARAKRGVIEGLDLPLREALALERRLNSPA